MFMTFWTVAVCAARSAHPREEDRGADCAACLHHQRDEGGDEAVDTDAGFVFADVDRITDNAVGMADTSTMHDLRNGESNEPEGAARSEEVADHSEQTAEAVAEDEARALVLQPTEHPGTDETGADDRGDEAERRGDGDESGVVADVGEVEDHDGHLAIGTEADHEEAEGDDDGVFVLEEGGNCFFIGILT